VRPFLERRADRDHVGHLALDWFTQRDGERVVQIILVVQVEAGDPLVVRLVEAPAVPARDAVEERTLRQLHLGLDGRSSAGAHDLDLDAHGGRQRAQRAFAYCAGLHVNEQGVLGERPGFVEALVRGINKVLELQHTTLVIERELDDAMGVGFQLFHGILRVHGQTEPDQRFAGLGLDDAQTRAGTQRVRHFTRRGDRVEQRGSGLGLDLGGDAFRDRGSLARLELARRGFFRRPVGRPVHHGRARTPVRGEPPAEESEGEGGKHDEDAVHVREALLPWLREWTDFLPRHRNETVRPVF